jgi:hypothetical protein
MIKVQPAHSRIVKTELPDRILLEMPPEGVFGLGGALAFVALAWIGFAVWGGTAALQSGHLEFAIFAAVAMSPALGLLLVGIALSRRRWTLSRSAERVRFEKRGLLGTSSRSWDAGDVTSAYTRREDANVHFLVLGFRNGRSEDVVSGESDEEMMWVAAMMGEARGERRAAPQVPLQTPAPPRVRTNEAIVPATLRCVKHPAGVVLSFLPLLHSRHRWWKLLGAALLGVALIGAASAITARRSVNAQRSARIAVAVLLLAVVVRLALLQRSATVRIMDGVVSIVQNQGRGKHQFPAEEVEFIQTFRGEGDTELQFLIRGRPKLRLFRGRPADELEWAARFLRLALRSRPEEAAALKVDAASGECQVCGEKMETRVVYCAKCRTPHHEECWSYVGTCSTYGCREIRFERA